MMTVVPKRRRRDQFSLRWLLLLFVSAALISALAARLLLPPDIDVLIGTEPMSFNRYDDLAGHTPLARLCRSVRSALQLPLRSPALRVEGARRVFHVDGRGERA